MSSPTRDLVGLTQVLVSFTVILHPVRQDGGSAVLASDSDGTMRATHTNDTALIVAARSGDRRALDELVTGYLPLVYTIVRRALGGHPDVDDVVQEIMLRAVRQLRLLRDPESFRPWLASIAMRHVSTHLHRRAATARRLVALDAAADVPDDEADVEGLTLLRVELSIQRRQVVRATQWLDPDDRALLSLWWLETAGQLTRGDLAAALDVSIAHAGDRLVVGVVEHGRIGVDIELVAPVFDQPALARRLCTPAERRRADGLPPADRRAWLTQLWAVKESYAKAVGAGLALDFREIGAADLRRRAAVRGVLTPASGVVHARIAVSWVAAAPSRFPSSARTAA
jgi:RNA polymerase sigma factor (sigma-70 family)